MLYTIEEMSEILGKSESTIRKMIKNGELKAKKGPERYFIEYTTENEAEVLIKRQLIGYLELYKCIVERGDKYDKCDKIIELLK